VLPLSEALESLYARVPLGMRLGLDAMREACARTGHPERAFEAVHVAGTNGKGSVSAMVESIARASGKKTGLFTSPHLSRFAERIRIDGEPVDDDTLRGLLGDALVRGADLSFFETATLAAFLAFREARVELAVIEVGLGGRLDATNVIPTPRAAAITRIAFDHTDRLGPTLLDIAREKAGIAKPGLEIVLGPVSGDVRAAIDSVAHEAGATTTLADDDEEAVRFVASARLGLPGAHQQDNARVAFLLGKRISADTSAIAKGLAVARWPGRLETLTLKDGPVLLDAAHNPDGIASLVAHLRGLAFPPDRVAIVFGVLADKEWAAMQDILADATSRRFYVAPKGRAAVSPEALRTRSPGEVASGVGEAIERARHAVGADGLVVVAGSIMLVGEARSLLLDLPRDPPVAL
jgi:dihydrofolate synthase/folylpolyglutamate synthase